MSDVDTSKIDFARVQQLLDVVHMCAGVGPKLTSLGNAAMTELTKMNDAIKVASREAEEERRQAEGVAQNQVLEDASEDKVRRPASYPSDSQTATLADANIRRL